MQELLSYFDVEHPWDIEWAHGANRREDLENHCSSPDIMMIEGDITMRDGTPVIAHTPSDEVDLSFDEWIEEIIASGKGAKLDYKDPLAVLPALEKLNEKSTEIPIFLNADILNGPGGLTPRVDADNFLRLCEAYNPKFILSLGWTTRISPGARYTEEMISSMSNIVVGANTTVTFPVRAHDLKASLSLLQPLIADPEHSITLWNDETLSDELKTWMTDTLNPSKFFYDLIDAEGKQIKL